MRACVCSCTLILRVFHNPTASAVSFHIYNIHICFFAIIVLQILHRRALYGIVIGIHAHTSVRQLLDRREYEKQINDLACSYTNKI